MQLRKEEAQRISGMTLSEKLGQMFVTGFPAEEMDESFRALVKDKKVGNVILTDEGNCPVTPVVQMLQGKWKLQILYELCIKCPMRFGELKKMLKPITNTALTNALKELEADDLIQRIQYNEMPLRVEYFLTEKGRDLLPVFYAISQWGMKYIP